MPSPFIDARIPVVFGREAERREGDALLLEGEGAAAAGLDWFLPGEIHPSGCACCPGGRSSAGQALSRLMLARVRRGGFFFSRVLAVVETQEGRAALREALTADPLASGYFREGG